MTAEISIDRAKRIVFVDGEPVRLPRLEFELLVVLVSRQGEVLTRAELLEMVWHSHRDWQSPATVTEHVRRLRLKLDRDPAEPSVITTVRGIGYAYEGSRADDVEPAGAFVDHGAAHCLVILDGTRIVHASPALVELLGADTAEEVVGRETFDFVTPSSLPAAARLAQQRACGEVPCPEQVALRRSDGTEVTVVVAASVVRWHGRTCHQVSIWPVADPTDVATTSRRRDALESAGRVLLRPDPAPATATARRAVSPSDDGLADDIARGVDAGEFEPHYEPIVHLETNRVLAVEALARWHHPTRGLLPPAAFLAAAERTGDLVRLGRRLLQLSCAQVVDWERAGHTVDLAVNLSARQLVDGSLLTDVTSALDAAHLPGQRLLVEITETDVIDDVDAAADALGHLAARGVRIAIDDFGTGWASLSYLQRFPVHVLKIDRSFTAGVLDNPNDLAIAQAIISLGNQLDLLVIAEGIETADQQAAMYDLGCWIGQGHLFGKPQPGGHVALSLPQPVDAAAGGRST